MPFFPFPSVTLEPLEGFRRNLTQMLTRLRQCAEAMFRMAGIKVKVILRGQRPYFFSLPLCNSWTPWRILKKPDTNVYQTETLCRSNIPDGWIQGQGHTDGSNAILLFPFPSVTLEALEGFRRNLTQMFTRLRRYAEAMVRMAGFNVKVILRGQRPYDFFSLPLCNSWTPWRMSKKPDTNVNQTETTCISNVPDCWIQRQCHT